VAGSIRHTEVIGNNEAERKQVKLHNFPELKSYPQSKPLAQLKINIATVICFIDASEKLETQKMDKRQTQPDRTEHLMRTLINEQK